MRQAARARPHKAGGTPAANPASYPRNETLYISGTQPGLFESDPVGYTELGEISVFEIDPATGVPVHVAKYTDSGNSDLIVPTDIVVSPDGDFVYLFNQNTSPNSPISRYSRNSSTGALTFAGAESRRAMRGVVAEGRESGTVGSCGSGVVASAPVLALDYAGLSFTGAY